MLEHSKQNYGPLPSELRAYRVRSRTSSRASPYPVRVRCISITAEIQANMAILGKPFAALDELPPAAPLSKISINPNIKVFSPRRHSTSSPSRLSASSCRHQSQPPRTATVCPGRGLRRVPEGLRSDGLSEARGSRAPSPVPSPVQARATTRRM